MRIASWNVNSVRTRLDQVLAWLEAQQPDVLCLQETKVADELFPSTAFEQLGYQCAISGQKAYNGVALISRRPMDDLQIGFTGLLTDDPQATELSDQKRVISALIDGIRVLNLYVPNGSSLSSDKYTYKLAWLLCGGYRSARRKYIHRLGCNISHTATASGVLEELGGGRRSARRCSRAGTARRGRQSGPARTGSAG